MVFSTEKDQGITAQSLDSELYFCLRLLGVQISPEVQGRELPYLVWVLSDPHAFVESRDNPALAELEPRFRVFRPLAQHLI